MHALGEFTTLVIFPLVGFLAGFAVQWWLQERRARQELLRALADRRAASLCTLWAQTTLPPSIARLPRNAFVPSDLRQAMDEEIVAWYTAQAGALYLSWPATKRLFAFLDLLRSDTASREELGRAVSLLRSRLKLDCGIYSAAESRRQLIRPRRAPWSSAAESGADPDRRTKASP